MVPPSTTSGRPVTAARRVGQYGSAKSTWMPPESKYVSARPLVRSTSWSGTTTAPGPLSGFRLPTAHGPKTRRTPSLRSAHMLARYGTVCAENWCVVAVPGQEGDLVFPDGADVTGALGGPYGVSTSMVRAPDSKKV